MRGRRARAVRWLLPAALTASAVLSLAFARRALVSLVLYDTPFAFDVGPRPAPPRLVREVVLVLVDGLTIDVSRRMPFLNELRRRGADLDCRVGTPSLSIPGRAVMASGAWTDVHGRPMNRGVRPLPVEHVFSLAAGAGLRTALVATAAPQALLGSVGQRVVVPGEAPGHTAMRDYEGELRTAGERSRAVIEDGAARPDLVMVDYMIVDEAGHEWGAASSEYARAAALADAELRRLAEGLDLASTVLMVTSDHGHTARGGHGGTEPEVMAAPLVMAGRLVRAGFRGGARQIDIAPTVSALLGLPVPAANQGRPLLEALDVDPDAARAILQATLAQRQVFVARYARWLGAAVPAAPPSAPRDLAALSRALDELDREQEAATEERLRTDRAGRRVAAAAVAVAPLVLFGLLLAAGAASRGDLARAFVAAAAGAALYAILFVPAGLGYSITAVNHDEQMPAFFARDMALGAAACAIAVAGAAALVPRESIEELGLATSSWLVAAAFASLFTWKMAAAYWWQGIIVRWHLPDQWWAFSIYLDLLVVGAVGLSWWILPLVARGGAALARRPAVTAAPRPEGRVATSGELG